MQVNLPANDHRKKEFNDETDMIDAITARYRYTMNLSGSRGNMQGIDPERPFLEQGQIDTYFTRGRYFVSIPSLVVHASIMLCAPSIFSLLLGLISGVQMIHPLVCFLLIITTAGFFSIGKALGGRKD
jgi:hypothetical protein